MELPTTVNERFRLTEVLGKGSQGTTYLAEDLDNGSPVAVKELNFRELDTWKAYELFRREGRVLRSLDHPSIPTYLDTFRVEQTGGADSLLLIREYVEGQNLQESIDRGERIDESEARALARQLLEIADYIHSLNPPVIHRDIKPSNIIDTGDEYILIDFGSVQSILPDKSGGSTIVGTTGFMPHEQLMGRSEPATDLYSIGATLVYLLSHVHPSEFEMERMKLQFHDRVTVSDNFRMFLDKLLEPQVEDRPQTARQALQLLDNRESNAPVESARQTISTSPSRDAETTDPVGWVMDKLHFGWAPPSWLSTVTSDKEPVLPSTTAFDVSARQSELEIQMPAQGATADNLKSIGITTVWVLSLVGLITMLAVYFGGTPGAVFGATIIASPGLLYISNLVHRLLKSIYESYTIDIRGDYLLLRRDFLGFRYSEAVYRDMISNVSVTYKFHRFREPIYLLEVETRDDTNHLMYNRQPSELTFVARALRRWLARELFDKDGAPRVRGLESPSLLFKER
jgi:serine/threonine protein kinase